MLYKHLPSLEIALRTDPGRRFYNEDGMLAVVPKYDREKGALFVVVDGMGGPENGAELRTLYTLSTTYYDAQGQDRLAALKEAMKQANAHLCEVARIRNRDLEWDGVGAKCIAVVLQGQTLYGTNVGDCRAYLVRDGKAKLLSEDHSWGELMVKAGQLTSDQARTHINHNVVTRCLGVADVNDDSFVEPVQDRDILLLCSDGISDGVKDEELGAMIGEHGLQESVERLVQLAKQRNHDNMALIAVRISLRNN